MESSILTQIITILVEGLGAIGEGVGTALSSMATAIFLTSSGALSVFGTLVITFAGLSLGLGLVRWVLNFITSLGARNN